MENWEVQPINEPCCRRKRAPNAWKVPSHMPCGSSFNNVRTRFLISPAALLVKVTASIDDGDIPWLIRYATRVVKTLVLPEPAPANTSIGPLKCFTALSWLGFNRSKLTLLDFILCQNS